MLADDAAVEAVMFGEDGAAQSLTAGAIHILMSTISIALSERLGPAKSTWQLRYSAGPKRQQRRSSS
jgi:3-hydroxyisobutyrate dehydrogenase-like beta-hydroxyacid dehydrogenase